MGVLTSMRSALVLAYMLSILWVRRNPLTLIHLVATPFTILFLLWVVVGTEYITFALAGTIVMIMVNAGGGLVGEAVWYRLTLRFQDILVASPVSRLSYILGLSFSQLFYSSPALALLISLLFVFGLTFQGGLVIILVLILTWLAMSSLGFYISTYIMNIRNSWQISALLTFSFAILPPVFYPLALIPSSLRWIAYAVPTTHSAILIREAASLPLTIPLNTFYSWLVLVGYTTLFLGLTLYKFRWREA